VRSLRLPSIIAQFCGVVGGSLHRLFKMDVRLSSEKDLTRLGDVVLQEVYIPGGASNMEPAGKCEGNIFFPTVGDIGELVLEEVDV